MDLRPSPATGSARIRGGTLATAHTEDVCCRSRGMFDAATCPANGTVGSTVGCEAGSSGYGFRISAPAAGPHAHGTVIFFCSGTTARRESRQVAALGGHQGRMLEARLGRNVARLGFSPQRRRERRLPEEQFQVGTASFRSTFSSSHARSSSGLITAVRPSLRACLTSPYPSQRTLVRRSFTCAHNPVCGGAHS